VTRRLFRDGVSEYFINKAPCRLKDIRSLLLDTRAGSKGIRPSSRAGLIVC